jgi:predicted permease
MSLFRKIPNTFRRSRSGQEIEAELQSHIEMRMADNIASGMSAEEARRDALMRFGSPGAIRERVTSMDLQMTLDAIGRDLSYSARQLRRSPGFALTAVVTLALGIGANVIVFSVLNALILRPVGLPHAERLYNVVQKPRGYDTQSYPDFLDYQRLNTTFDGMAAYRLTDAGLRRGNAVTKCWLNQVSGNYFDVLGVQPALGSFFHAGDEHGSNSAPFAVLSNAFWRNEFGTDPHVIGTTVEINKHPFTVVGVATATFHGVDLFFWPDVWVPMVNEQQISGFDFLSRRGNHTIWVMGKLKQGVTPLQAAENLNAIAAQLAKQYPLFDDGMGARLVEPGLMGDQLGGPTQAFLLGIMLLAILVLLAACANLASIFAARAADRNRELAIRLAIGSSRWHILRQVLSEAVLTSIIGGLLGTVLSFVLLRVLSVWQPFAEFPVHVTVVPDTRVYVLALFVSLATGTFFGLLPVRQIWKLDGSLAVNHGEGTHGFFRRFALRDLLLGIQIAICSLLVMSSLVALRGMVNSLHAPLGFRPQEVVLSATDMHMAGYADDSALPVQKRMMEAAARLPGVIAVGTIDETPLGTGGSSGPVYLQDTTDFRPSTSVFAAKYYSISPGYLEAAGTRLLQGRDFTGHDDAKTPPVALVNETFARNMFRTDSALGRQFKLSPKDSYTIVGIVENGKYDSLTEDPTPAMFFPLAQAPDSDITLVVRSKLSSEQTAGELNRMLTGIDPSLPFTIQSWDDALSLVLFPARVATVGLGVMGLLASLLAVTGVFGMAAYSVSKRMKELSIRVALGASSASLIASAVGRPLLLVLSGSAVGVLLGHLASTTLAQIVYQATSHDPLVLGGVVVTMSLLALLAVWVPVRRALTINPALLLRRE